MNRESFTVTFHADNIPNRDARNFALHVLGWWKPNVGAVERAILEQRWTETLRAMFHQCWRDRTDMDVRVYMKGADPALEIKRVYPTTKLISKKAP